MSFKSVLKAIFVTPFANFFKSDAGKQYAQSAKALLGTAEGQAALAVVSNLNDLTDLSSTAKRTEALAKIAAVLVPVGITLAESEIALLVETAVSYLKGKFGTQDVTVTPAISDAAKSVVAEVK